MKPKLISSVLSRRAGFRHLGVLMPLFALGAASTTAAESGPLAQVLTTGTAPMQSTGPKIQFAEAIHDFGKVDSGQVVKYELSSRTVATRCSR